LPCTKENVSIRDASRCCPPSFTVMISFSYGKSHVKMGLHTMTMRDL
jgi:hypothetical protein